VERRKYLNVRRNIRIKEGNSLEVIKHIDRIIKEAWMYNVSKDYQSNFLLKEDTLKNALYFHIRNIIGDQYLQDNSIRIFTEYYLDNNERADIAIVRLNNEDGEYFHLSEQVEEVLAVIELKYKATIQTINYFFDDITKVKRYIKTRKYKDTQFYLGFIHEEEYDLKETSWLYPRQQTSWALGRLTELSAFINQEDMSVVFSVLSHNNLNKELDGAEQF
jgi:hypothetical protein